MNAIITGLAIVGFASGVVAMVAGLAILLMPQRYFIVSVKEKE